MNSGYLLRIAGAVVVFLTVGCGDSGTGPLNPGGNSNVRFTSTPSSPAANSLSLVQSSSSASVLTLNVVATEVNDFFGVGFDLVWNPDILTFQSASRGSFLSADNNTVDFAAMLADIEPGPGETIDPGRLTVGTTRLFPAPGNNGSGVIATLTFGAGTTGSTGMSFEAFSGFNSSGGDVSGLNFAGGNATVR